MTISLCMIVKNEEDVMDRCLSSIKDYVDEIIVIDTGSTDKTKEIASKYTKLIYDFPWIDDFAAARNFSFSKAASDFIMWMDADDILPVHMQEKFLAMKESLTKNVDIVMMQYHIAFDAQNHVTFSYDRERIVRREKNYQWVGEIHEVIVPAGRIIYSEAAVEHRKLRAGDPDRNIRIFEKMLQQGKAFDPRQQYYYGRELYYHGRYQEAEVMINQFLDGNKGWIENNINACQDLANCYYAMNRPLDALQSLFRSFQYDLPRAGICCDIGKHFIEKNQYRQAVYWYETAADADPLSGRGGFINPDCYDFLPYLQLCLCYDKLGDYQKAYMYHLKAKELKPQNAAIIYNEQYFSKLLQHNLVAAV